MSNGIKSLSIIIVAVVILSLLCLLVEGKTKHSFLHIRNLGVIHFLHRFQYDAQLASHRQAVWCRRSFPLFHIILASVACPHTRGLVYLVKNSWAANHLQNVARLFAWIYFHFDGMLFWWVFFSVLSNVCACVHAGAMFPPRRSSVYIYSPYGSIITLAISAWLFKNVRYTTQCML